MITEGKLLLAAVLYLLLIFTVSGIIYSLRFRWYKTHSNLSDYGIRQMLDFGNYLMYSFIGATIIMFIVGVVMKIIELYNVPIK
jgi:p-aminobenzoyl-glutamate transporter AbgT